MTCQIECQKEYLKKIKKYIQQMSEDTSDRIDVRIYVGYHAFGQKMVESDVSAISAFQVVDMFAHLVLQPDR